MFDLNDHESKIRKSIDSIIHFYSKIFQSGGAFDDNCITINCNQEGRKIGFHFEYMFTETVRQEKTSMDALGFEP